MPETQSQAAQISLMRTYLRTLAFMLFLLVILFNYKHLIQYYSAFSLANAMTRLDPEQLLSEGLILDIGYFLGVVIVLHACWAAVITLSCRPWFKLIRNENIKTQIWLVLLLLHLILALAANSYFYPTSLLGIFRGTPLASAPFIGLLASLLAANFLYGLIGSLYASLGITRVNTLLASMLLLTALLSINSPKSGNSTASQTPNIFIIGIDALRPDHLAYRGGDSKLAPNLNALLAKATVYNKAYTPQGRTYVAWMSILSGQYPTTNGARFNLAPPELVEHKFPLLSELSALGYQTSYAMDERRFNQIDEDYGFDISIGPKIGAADAVIASLADLPLVNLLSNTLGSRYLFPYLFINRAYGKAYDPEVFNHEVLSGLAMDRPNFLAIHFCQLHWPFTSKDFVELEPARWDGNYNHYMYQQMLKKVDRQVADFIQGLARLGLLDNALVYLLSDHGEGFMLSQDRLMAATSADKASQSHGKLKVAAWGHGTNLLAQEQSDVLLARLRYRNGRVVSAPQRVDGLFSLVDLAPSIFKELGLGAKSKAAKFDGEPLPRPWMPKDLERKIYVESSIPVRSVNASFIDEKRVLSETASFYEVRDNGRAVMKPEDYKLSIALKQRAVYYRQWQLTLLPKEDRLILVDTQAKNWQSLADYRGAAPWREMLAALCAHYAKDPGFPGPRQCVDKYLASNLGGAARQAPGSPP
ncbi:sulfatase-like hydrolase/transferase [Shewanella salipaludis]|uniref:Sulfatase-like hydrolase/transferase n=1 Tax=Shewanella salipaludis TaxID=2723052 RepID=A0A972JJ89_9GAMM|nr:sulfatase-like hydrolase/transferase [Shewanella salipaludis]NMH64850.1 sulfatase-like hydrolase/transferase [Shewanella salipaludis]